MILRAILFWLVWILLAPIEFIYYLSGKRSTAYYLSNIAATKTGLVRASVWERFVTRKPKRAAELLAEKRVKNFIRENPYTTRKLYN